jgi:hypothetical protein
MIDILANKVDGVIEEQKKAKAKVDDDRHELVELISIQATSTCN